MSDTPLPLGKLPPPLLARLLARTPADDPRVLVGPGVGLDCAVVEMGDRLLVCKSDPVTFVTDALGHYLVQVNANDLATTGAEPRWLLVTLLLPEGRATPALARRMCAALGLDPLATIASGALLLTAPAGDAAAIRAALAAAGITCAEIGTVEAGPPEVVARGPEGTAPRPAPPRDEIARLFEG